MHCFVGTVRAKFRSLGCFAKMSINPCGTSEAVGGVVLCKMRVFQSLLCWQQEFQQLRFVSRNFDHCAEMCCMEAENNAWGSDSVGCGKSLLAGHAKKKRK